MTVVSFDGNVYTGKTTLIKFLSDKYGYTSIGEHSLFIESIPSRSIYKNEYLDMQERYLSVDIHPRMSTLREGINLLDRSFVSVAAHVYALYELGLTDIRESFIDLFKKKIKEIIFPDVFIWVRCGYDTSRARCLLVNNRKKTEDIYLSEKYFESIEKFNAIWILAVRGFVVSTETELTDKWCSMVHDRILGNLEMNSVHKVTTLDNLRKCLDLWDRGANS